MVASSLGTANEATAYLTAVGGFAAVALVLLLLLGRRWRAPRAALAVSLHPYDDAHDALSKPIFAERVLELEDDGEELQLRVQTSEDVECRYEEKNENAPAKQVELIETALRHTALRETRIDDVVRAAEHLHTLEAQSSVDSDVIGNQDTALLCGERGAAGGGCVELTLLYDAPVRSMTLHVLQARALPPPAAPPAASAAAAVLQTQVRVVLMPMKKQKFKTKVRYGENPQYMESFVFHKINPEDVHGLGLRVRVYACARLRRQRLLGEAALRFARLDLAAENALALPLRRARRHLQLPPLEPSPLPSSLASPSSICSSVVGVTGVTGITGVGAGVAEGSLPRSESASSCCSARAAPELLLGLQYSGSTGHLSVEVIKGTHFRKLSGNNSPETYVKLSLVSSLGLEMCRAKSTRRAHSNPLYKELFIFQVALFQLSEVTLMVSVWWRRSVKRNEMVGWFSLGLNSSGREEARHWQAACERPGEQVQQWHVLLDT